MNRRTCPGPRQDGSALPSLAKVMGRTLLDKIEESALDLKTDLPSLLRQCVALGGRSGSDGLRAWARQELNGYGQDDEVPEYRVLPASLHVDGANMRFRITGEQISPMALPDFARDDVKEEQVMTTSIGRDRSPRRAPDSPRRVLGKALVRRCLGSRAVHDDAAGREPARRARLQAGQRDVTRRCARRGPNEAH